MRRTLALMLLLSTVMYSPLASADELTVTRGEAVEEIAHTVDVRIEDGLARFTVRRTFSNMGSRAEEACLQIDLPPGAAATGLRIRARDRWYDAELMEAEEAARKYTELTGKGIAEPKDPAILYWRWADSLGLQIFPIFPGATSTVEYTLTAPLRYREGKHIVSYPHGLLDPDSSAESLPLATPVLRVLPSHGDATTAVWINGQRAAPDTSIVLTPPPEPVWLGEGSPPFGASFVTSAIEVRKAGTVNAATVDVAIDHTYRGDLRLQLVLPTGESIDIDDPTGDENDVRASYEVELRTDTSAAGTWHLRVMDDAGLDVGTIEGFGLALRGESFSTTEQASDLPMFIPDAPSGDGVEGLSLIEVAAPDMNIIAARYGRVKANASTTFARMDVEAAPELGQVPVKASVVFVVDASRSGPSVLEQLELARAYLTHLPDAQVEVVLFRRQGARVFGAFETTASFDGAVAAAASAGAFETGNGSALEEGLAVAIDALRSRKGPKRVVVTTDALLRSRYSNALALDILSAGPDLTLHVVEPQGAGFGELIRTDRHDLAAVAMATGGLAYELSFPHLFKDLVPLSLGLVRPVSIDHLEIEGIDTRLLPEIPDSLPEGSSYHFMENLAAAPKKLVVRGQLWSRTFERTVATTNRYNRATAAFVFSEDEYDDLSEEEMLTIAMFGEVVSPVTSYLAVEPGVRPSTVGLEFLSSAYGSGSGAGFGGSGRGVSLVSREEIVERLAGPVRTCVAQHSPPSGWSVDLDVETTFIEVVDVIPGGAKNGFRTCIAEAAWALSLPGIGYDQERELHTMSFDASVLGR